MILREQDGRLLVFRQTDHALLSGAFARGWGSVALPSLERRRSVLVAAARHDDGWAEWELAPRVRADGRPVDFIGIPVDEHVPLYRRGIDLVEDEDDYAGLVASLHGERLYTKPFHPGMDPRIDHLQGGDAQLAQDYVAGERTRQGRLVAQVGEADGVAAEAVREQAEEAWRLLQVWDRLSLLVCMQDLATEPSQSLPSVRGSDGQDIAIEARGSRDGALLLDPYPLASDPARFSIEASVLEATTWADDASFREDYRTAPRVPVTFECRAP